MHRKSLLTLFVLALVATFPAAAQEMTVDEVIAKNIEARGGAEAFENMEDVRVTGKMVGMGGTAMELPMTIEWSRPGMVRQEINVQGQTIVQAYDGENAWMIMPMTGSTEPQEMPEEAAAQFREQADYEGALVNYKEKGHTAEYMGMEDVEGTPAHKIKLTRKGGEEDIYYLDGDAFIEIKSIFKRELQGQPMEVEITYGDYKEVGGIMMPHSLDLTMGGQQTGVVTIEKIEVNPGLDAKIFAMPKAEPAAADAG